MDSELSLLLRSHPALTLVNEGKRVNSVFFMVHMHFSYQLFGNFRYNLSFWRIVPIIAHPVCRVFTANRTPFIH
jgi:hypothetical protein